METLYEADIQNYWSKDVLAASTSQECSIHYNHGNINYNGNPFQQAQSSWSGNTSCENNAYGAQKPLHLFGPVIQAGEHTQESSCAPAIESFVHPNASTGFETTSSKATPIPQDEVCFGMITGLKAEIKMSFENISLRNTPVNLASPSSFNTIESTPSYGHLNDRESQILGPLLEEKEIELQACCSSDDEVLRPPKKRSREGLLKVICSLNIILYGPEDMFEDIGDYLGRCKCYLQDPVGCYKDVKYYNPHRLSSVLEDDCQMTISGFMNQPDITLEEFQRQINALDVLDTEYELPEANQPPFIRTSLLSHQKQAVGFLIKKERDGVKQNFAPYVTGTKKNLPSLCGGILADPMGLGKSLTILALIASDLIEKETEDGLEPWSPGPTLLIVPPPLLEEWKGQIKEHMQPGVFRYTTHYGSDRIDDIQDLGRYNIIITTYQTVLADWRKATQSLGTSTMFCVDWRRIVLDEAHVIRNSKSETAKALCELRGRARWTVTGTPIQNGLTDLASLLKFIDISVYSEFCSIANEFSNIWRRGFRDDAVKVLKNFLHHILLRRPAGTICLPRRHDIIYPLIFSPDEMSIYERNRSVIRSGVNAALNSAVQSSSDTTTSVTVLQQINSLRMICNLGTFYRHKLQETIEEASSAYRSSTLTGKYYAEMLAAGEAICSQCSTYIEHAVDIPSYIGVNEALLYMSQCLRLLCVECFNSNSFSTGWCGHSPPCHSAPVLRQSNTESSAFQLPTKVLTLIEQLRAADPGSKSVVFSTWTSSLDVIELGLRGVPISYVRVDGTSTPKAREKALQKFREDPTVQVILMTLACGSVGINLTAASCAYLMEPSWNPTVEEQALARIHRMGQMKETRTIRFFMKGSLEEHIMRIQKSKEELASLVLQQSNRPGANLNVEVLQKLHSLL